MTRKAFECIECGTEYTVVYDAEESLTKPAHCPFCGEIASDEDKGRGDDDEEYWDE